MNIYGLGVYGKKSSRRDCRATMLRLSFMLLGATVLTLAAHAQVVAHGPGLTSFTDTLGEHVIYIGCCADSDVHEQILSPGATSWSTAKDLTALAGGASPSSWSTLTAFADKSGEHVFFEDDNGDVHRLYLSSTAGSRWTDTNLTVLTGNTHNAPAYVPLAGFSDSSGQHVFYIDVFQDVHQVYLSSVSGSNWIDQDLNVRADAPTDLASGTALAAFSDSSGEHVFYVGTNSHVHQLYFSASGWTHQDLNVRASATTNAASGKVGSGLAALSDSSGEHVFYVGTNFHIYQLYISSALGSSWTHQDLTALTGGDPAVENLGSLGDESSPLAAYFDKATIAGNGGEHVYYVNSNEEICQLNYDGRWEFVNLTKAAGTGYQVNVLSALTGFADTSDASAHVFYVGQQDQQIQQFYYTAASGWAYQDVSTSTVP